MPSVNDIHARLNPTEVARVARPRRVEELQDEVARVRGAGGSVCLAGGRHAMGGQQFASGGVLIDLSALDRVLAFDPVRGLIDVEAGMQWPALVDWLWAHQPPPDRDHGLGWGIVQKQTGADRLSLGGAVSANAHGRGLAFAPIVQDVESLVLIDADGRTRRCSREMDGDLFRHAVGGYGLFGAIASVRLRLAPRRRLKRLVEIVDADDLIAHLESRRDAGCLYGDFQFRTDEDSPAYLREGVCSCYRPVDDDDPSSDGPRRELSEADWRRLYRLAHTDRAELYRVYAGFYRATHGQCYWSDRHQLSVYIDGYHQELDLLIGATTAHSEMISELYVPRADLPALLRRIADETRRRRAPMIYGTVRLIETDAETALPWARRAWACVVMNLCVRHDPSGIATAAETFRALIDHALAFGGSYFPTYHRWASRDQVLRSHPAMPAFLAAKRRHDPGELFQSDWYRHHRRLFDEPT